MSWNWRCLQSYLFKIITLATKINNVKLKLSLWHSMHIHLCCANVKMKNKLNNFFINLTKWKINNQFINSNYKVLRSLSSVFKFLSWHETNLWVSASFIFSFFIFFLFWANFSNTHLTLTFLSYETPPHGLSLHLLDPHK